MVTLLIGTATYQRLAGELEAVSSQVRWILLDPEGNCRDQQGKSLDPALLRFDAAYGNDDTLMGPATRVFLRILLSSPPLAWFQSFAAGYEHPMLRKLGAHAASYSNCHVQAETMAEWALWQSLDFFRAGSAHRRNQQAREWQRLPARELQGSHWVIVGFGAVGEAVARRIRPLGATVTGIRRSQPRADTLDEWLPAVNTTVLQRADVVLLAVPVTDDTRWLANAAFFTAMRSDALLLNLGRGELVDENALLAALDAEELGHAALDVVSKEPLPAEHPLWRHPKITITPHDSPASAATRDRQDAFFVANLQRWLAQETPLNIVPKSEFESL